MAGYINDHIGIEAIQNLIYFRQYVCVSVYIANQRKFTTLLLGGDVTTLPLVLKTRAGGDGKAGNILSRSYMD